MMAVLSQPDYGFNLDDDLRLTNPKLMQNFGTTYAEMLDWMLRRVAD
ncbi:MAG: hypothetical protein R3F19_24270 [Verrucomicrobiales bacterium]